jgi:hypothetical protein
MGPHRRDVIKGLSTLGLLAIAPSRLAHSCEVPGEPSSSALGFLGCPFTATSLGNITVGSSSKRHVYLPFISPYDGYAETLTFYAVWADGGYGAGTGGTIEITLVDSNNGEPGTKVRGGSIIHTDPRSRYGGRGKWSLKGTFSQPVGPLESGKLYFVHFNNIAINDVDNYMGVDVLNHAMGLAYGSKIVPSSLLKAFYRSDAGELKTHTARVNNSLDIGYVGGKHFSWPYMEAWLANSSHWNAKVTGSQWSRQHLIPDQAMTVTEVTVAARSISGSGSMTVELRNTANTVLAKASIPASAFSTDKQVFCPPQKLSAPVTVSAGVEVVATLRSDSSTTFVSYPLRCGAKSGGAYTKLVNGWCEWSTDSGGSWSGGWYGWNSDRRLKVADLPIAFR